MNNLTADQIRRVHEAIAECDKQIAREMEYTERNRDQKAINFHIQHKAKMIGMLEGK